MDDSLNLKAISDKDTVESLLKKTQILFRQQKYLEAKKILQDILKKDSGNAAAYNNLGSIYLIRGRLARAERYFHKAIELDHTLTDAHENLKSITKLKKRKTHTEIKNEIENLEARSKELIQVKDLDEAIEVSKQILELDPTNVKIYNNLGILYFQEKEHEEAENYFVRALELYFHHGMVFDDQYKIIKDNLSKLREKIGSNVSDYLRSNLLNEVQEKLSMGEDVLNTFLGIMRVFFESRQHNISTLLVITTKRLIIYYKSSRVYSGEAKWVEYKMEDIRDCSIIKGIQKCTLVIDTADSEYRFYSPNRHEMKAFMIALRELSHPKEAPAVEALTGLKLSASSDVYTRVSLGLLSILKDLGVLTKAEFEAKEKTLVSGKKSASPFRKRGGLIPGKKSREEQ
ncbi:MAG: tetratricopeptide repeat protein [Candidatus Eremiobacteraeota bacterium]|nr:tetratricopeptide repeat protein [Candidatus Eremiobacteraeota bacterium]